MLEGGKKRSTYGRDAAGVESHPTRETDVGRALVNVFAPSNKAILPRGLSRLVFAERPPSPRAPQVLDLGPSKLLFSVNTIHPKPLNASREDCLHVGHRWR